MIILLFVLILLFTIIALNDTTEKKMAPPTKVFVVDESMHQRSQRSSPSLSSNNNNNDNNNNDSFDLMPVVTSTTNVATLTSSMERFRERLDELEKLVRETNDKPYPTFEQLVVMRRDIDKVNATAANIASSESERYARLAEERLTKRVDDLLNERLNERFDRPVDERFKEQLNEYLNIRLDEKLNDRLINRPNDDEKSRANDEVKRYLRDELKHRLDDELKRRFDVDWERTLTQRLLPSLSSSLLKTSSSSSASLPSSSSSSSFASSNDNFIDREELSKQLNKRFAAFNEQLKQELSEKLNQGLNDFLNKTFDARVKRIDARIDANVSKIDAHVARIDTRVGKIDSRVASVDERVERIDARARNNTGIVRVDATSDETKESVKNPLKDQIKQQIKDLAKEQAMKQSLYFPSTNIVRLVWFDAIGGFLNDTNELFHEYMRDADVLAAHRVTLNENRFSSHLRKIGSVDVFHPVNNRRSHFLVLIVTGHGEKKKTFTASGFCLNANLNFQLDRTKVYESNGVRLLTVWGLLFDHVYAVFGGFFATNNGNNTVVTNDVQRYDRLDVIQQLSKDMDAMSAYEKTAYRSSDYRAFLLGDLGLTNADFQTLRRDLEPRFRCEYDSCVKGSMITSITNGFHHNVHALSNTDVLDFDAKQTLESSMCVHVTYSTHDWATVRDVKRRRRYGATTDTLHDRTIV